MATKKCPNGMYAEIKYDGERVQVHKQGDRFEFFSRSLKPVQPHKVRTSFLGVLTRSDHQVIRLCANLGRYQDLLSVRKLT